jgi:hypothetical protein
LLPGSLGTTNTARPLLASLSVTWRREPVSLLIILADASETMNLDKSSGVCSEKNHGSRPSLKKKCSDSLAISSGERELLRRQNGLDFNENRRENFLIKSLHCDKQRARMDKDG